MALIDDLLQELEQETRTTRRVLERVPDHQLAWRPHEKARTLGELALHVAMVPGGVAELVASPSPAQAPQFTDPSPKSASELIPALDQSLAKAKQVLGGMDDATLVATWRLMQGGGRVASLLIRDRELADSLVEGFQELWRKAMRSLREVGADPRGREALSLTKGG